MLTREQVYSLRDKYPKAERPLNGWVEDEATGAIIVFGTDSVYYNGKYYSLTSGRMISQGNYVQSLRVHVGHAPLQLAGTGIILHKIENGEYKFLLQLRVDHNKYGLLGGGIELGESYEECAVGELLQEASLIAETEDLTLLKVYAGPKHITRHPSQDIVYHTVVVYSLDYSKCRKAPVAFDSSETKSLVWVTKSEITQILNEQKVFPNNIPILEDIVKTLY